jgi:hypothetical protein
MDSLHSMIRIRFFSSFCDGMTLPELFLKIHCLDKFSWSQYGKSYCFTNDNDFTHAILLNTPMPPELSKKIPKEHIIGLAYEPPQFPQYLGLTHTFVNYAKEHIGKYFIGNSRGFPNPFLEGYGYMTHTIPPDLEEIPSPKPKYMSIMISQKGFAPGHLYRHQLVQEILKTDLPIDIYGRGCKYYKQHLIDSRFKGEFTDKEPYLEYEYHIAIENFQNPHYFSEKIINPLLCGTTPVYLGCTNIHSYFGDSLIDLTGNVQEDMTLLIKLCREYQEGIKCKSTKMTQEEILKIVSIDTLIQKEFL